MKWTAGIHRLLFGDLVGIIIYARFFLQRQIDNPLYACFKISID